MINLQIKGIYDIELKGAAAGFAIIMKDQSGNSYQANFITRRNYMDGAKKTFGRLLPIKVPRIIDLGELFTTA